MNEIIQHSRKHSFIVKHLKYCHSIQKQAHDGIIQIITK